MNCTKSLQMACFTNILWAGGLSQSQILTHPGHSFVTARSWAGGLGVMTSPLQLLKQSERRSSAVQIRLGPS